MDEFPIVDVVEARAADDHKLWLKFSDGCEGVADLADFIAAGGPMVEPLREPAFFARVAVDFGVPTWPNGFDMDAINLYMTLRDVGALKRVAVA